MTYRVEPNKFHASGVEDDGYRFASKAEHRRYQELRLLERAGEIEDLQVHPFWFLLVPVLGTPRSRVVVGRYTADFKYTRLPAEEEVVEDVKGGAATRTEAYRLRKKMIEATYGIKIVEVEA